VVKQYLFIFRFACQYAHSKMTGTEAEVIQNYIFLIKLELRSKKIIWGNHIQYKIEMQQDVNNIFNQPALDWTWNLVIGQTHFIFKMQSLIKLVDVWLRFSK